MARDLELVTAPADALLSVDELRQHCNVTDPDDDGLLADYLAAGVGHLDGPGGILGRAIATQTWRLYLDGFPASCGRSTSIRLPLPPLQSVTAITYVDADGAEQTLASSVYSVLAGERAEVALAPDQSWPATRRQPRAVSVAFVCGWAPDDGVWPAKVQPIRHALKMMVAAMYEGRETWAEIPVGLLRPLRVPRL